MELKERAKKNLGDVVGNVVVAGSLGAAMGYEMYVGVESLLYKEYLLAGVGLLITLTSAYALSYILAAIKVGDLSHEASEQNKSRIKMIELTERYDNYTLH